MHLSQKLLAYLAAVTSVDLGAVVSDVTSGAVKTRGKGFLSKTKVMEKHDQDWCSDRCSYPFNCKDGDPNNCEFVDPPKRCFDLCFRCDEDQPPEDYGFKNPEQWCRCDLIKGACDELGTVQSQCLTLYDFDKCWQPKQLDMHQAEDGLGDAAGLGNVTTEGMIKTQEIGDDAKDWGEDALNKTEEVGESFGEFGEDLLNKSKEMGGDALGLPKNYVGILVAKFENCDPCLRALDCEEKSHYVGDTSGLPPGDILHCEIEGENPQQLLMTVTAKRSSSAAVANCFAGDGPSNLCGDPLKEDNIVASIEGKDFDNWWLPSTLNFVITLNLNFEFKNVKYSMPGFKIGQGHTRDHNRWWLGWKNCESDQIGYLEWPLTDLGCYASGKGFRPAVLKMTCAAGPNGEKVGFIWCGHGNEVFTFWLFDPKSEAA